MRFPLNAYLLALFSAFVTTVLSVPGWRRWCLQAGLVDHPGPRKIHQEPIPLAGGLALMTGLLVPTLLAALFLFFKGGTDGNTALSSGNDLKPFTQFGAPFSQNATF